MCANVSFVSKQEVRLLSLRRLQLCSLKMLRFLRRLFLASVRQCHTDVISLDKYSIV